MATAAPTANDLMRDLSPAETKTLESGKLITVTQRSPPGVQVQALIRCAPEDMMALLTDYSRMPDHIYGLERADILHSRGDATTVRFTMKLPFPVGRIVWTNEIQKTVMGGIHTLEWSLIDGDLEVNEGRLVMTTHREDNDFLYANYTVRVQSKSRLPKSAERLATRWLLPKIVGKLRRVAEK